MNALASKKSLMDDYTKRITSFLIAASILLVTVESPATIRVNKQSASIVTQKINSNLGQTPAELVEFFYQFFFVPIDVTTRPCVGNLLKYKASSPSPIFLGATGFVDKHGTYVTIGSKLITDPHEIAKILAHSKPVPAFNFENLNAYETRIKDLKTIIFVDSRNRYIIEGGAVWTNTLENLTFNASTATIPHAYSTTVYNTNQKLTYLLEGSPKECKTIFVTGDPNCPACHDFYESTLPYVVSGELSIHWTFASFINPTSPGRVFAIWDADVRAGTNFPRTRLGAFVYNETFFTAPDNGGIPPSTNPSKSAIKLLNQTYQAFFESLPGSPFITFKDVHGKDSFQIGTPTDIDAFVSSIQSKSCEICKNP